MRRIKKGDIVRRNGLEGVVVGCKRKSILVRWGGRHDYTTYVNRMWFRRATLITGSAIVYQRESPAFRPGSTSTKVK